MLQRYHVAQGADICARTGAKRLEAPRLVNVQHPDLEGLRRRQGARDQLPQALLHIALHLDTLPVAAGRSGIGGIGMV